VKLDIILGRAVKNHQEEHRKTSQQSQQNRKSIMQSEYSYCIRNSVNRMVFN